MRNKVNLVTYKDITDFVNIVSNLDGKIKLTDGDSFCINAKSLIGVMATVEWDNVYCESEKDIYRHISKWVV